ncbi:hypothetical protein BDW69DRAFT_200311 [Aspergillus filifer]
MGSRTESLPTLRWGIIGAGLISSWFTKDITLPRRSPAALHKIQAVGSSTSAQKANEFVKTHLSHLTPAPKTYGTYEEVYSDPEVDIIYIGTPHALHKSQCLSAIRANKHVLCEKAFTLNASEAREVLDAAREEGVFIMEAMWTRFLPVTRALQKALHEERVIGDVRRVFCDFGLDMQVQTLEGSSRLRDARLGAGSLLDLGVYALTWGVFVLEAPSCVKSDSEDGKRERKRERERQKPEIIASQVLQDGVDIASTFVLKYPATGKIGILSSSVEFKTPEAFMRIEGSEGVVVVEGVATSKPRAFTVYRKGTAGAGAGAEKECEKYEVEVEGMGFHFEADAVAQSIFLGLRENEVMDHAETLRVMEMLDEIRAQGGARFPGEDESLSDLVR